MDGGIKAFREVMDQMIGGFILYNCKMDENEKIDESTLQITQ